MIRNKKGTSLVQVLIMSALLITLATSMLRVIFASHVEVDRMTKLDLYKGLIDACYAQKQVQWAGVACAETSPCTYTTSIGPVTVTPSCAAGQVSFTINY